MQCGLVTYIRYVGSRESRRQYSQSMQTNYNKNEIFTTIEANCMQKIEQRQSLSQILPLRVGVWWFVQLQGRQMHLEYLFSLNERRQIDGYVPIKSTRTQQGLQK